MTSASATRTSDRLVEALAAARNALPDNLVAEDLERYFTVLGLDPERVIIHVRGLAEEIAAAEGPGDSIAFALVFYLWGIETARPTEPRLSFSPTAIREHFELHVGTDRFIADWVETATDEQLRSVGEACLDADPLHAVFHEVLVNAIVEHLSPDATP